MENLITAKAQRQLKYLKNFTFISDKTWQRDFERIVPQGNERLIGFYENPQTKSPEYLIISTSGLYYRLNSSSYSYINFRDIQSVSAAIENKHLANSLTIVIDNGTSIEFYLEGGDDKFRDVWGMLSFLKNAVGISKKLV